MENEKKIIIYGINQEAQALYAMLKTEKQRTVEAFVVDAAYRKADTLRGLPVWEAETMEQRFPPEQYEVCLSFGYRNMVHNREQKFYECKAKGYMLFTFISKNAILYTQDIGEGCIIYPGCILMPNARIGQGNFLETGCTLCHDVNIKDFNFLSARTCLCGGVEVGSNCFLGAGTVVANGRKIGNECFVAAAGRVSKNLAAGQAVLPAKAEPCRLSGAKVMKIMG